MQSAADLDYDIDAAIDICGGDARAAVASLLVTVSFLEAELAELRGLISNGYRRGRIAKPSDGPAHAKASNGT